MQVFPYEQRNSAAITAYLGARPGYASLADMTRIVSPSTIIFELRSLFNLGCAECDGTVYISDLMRSGYRANVLCRSCLRRRTF